MSPPPQAALEPQFERLFPSPATITAAEALDELNAVGEASCDLPHLMVNFVASADGRVAIGGRSAPLSDPGDRAMFHGLRERVDAIFAGTRTMSIERYGRMIPDARRRRRRAGRGLAPDPLACLMTRSGTVPTEIPLFGDPDSRVVVFCATQPDLGDPRAQVETVVLDPGELTLTTMMRRLRSAYDVRSLLCEGGPTMFGALLQESLVDELFLTLSPRLAGGGRDPTLTSGPPLSAPLGLELRWVLKRENTLFLRYARG